MIGRGIQGNATVWKTAASSAQKYSCQADLAAQKHNRKVYGVSGLE